MSVSVNLRHYRALASLQGRGMQGLTPDVDLSGLRTSSKGFLRRSSVRRFAVDLANPRLQRTALRAAAEPPGR